MTPINAHIPPDSPLATGLHRVLMAAQAHRLDNWAHPRARAIAGALRATARDRASTIEAEWLGRVESRRAEIPFAMAATPSGHVGILFAMGPGEGGPAGPDGPAERLGQAWEVCRWASTPPIWGGFLFRLVRALRPRDAFELGTGLGLSGAYVAAALELNGLGRLTTVDSHETASRIATDGFSDLGLASRVRVEGGRVEELASGVLPEIAPIDFAILDGEHTFAATTQHFELIRPHLAPGATVVFDDITQGDEMRAAWRHVIAAPTVAFAVGLRRIGVLVLAGDADE